MSSLSSFLNGLNPVVIAHRGGAKLRPENTLDAFAHAVALGVDALECDVHLSRDGEPVVIHDATLDRTTDRTGPVSALTADELVHVDAAFRFGEAEGFPYRGRGIGVPRLDLILGRFPGLPLVIEIKGDDPMVGRRVMETVVAARALDRVVVGGFSERVLRGVRTSFPTVPTSAARVEVQSALRRSYLWLPPRATGMALFQIPLRLRGRRVLTRRLVRAVRRGGLSVQAWIVDEPDDMRTILEWGVTGLITDRPDVAMEVADGWRRARATS